jgi:hypothetical protein
MADEGIEECPSSLEDTQDTTRRGERGQLLSDRGNKVADLGDVVVKK